MATSNDLNLRQFVINTISKANYDQLSADGQLQQNQLYFVDDAPIDAKGAKVRNVATPELSSDAATKGYVDVALQHVNISPLSGFTYNLAQEGASTELLVAVGRALGATVLE